MMRPKALDHLALKVTDMERSLQFYHQVLGLDLIRRSGPSEAGGEAAVLQAGRQKIDLFSRPDFVAADKEDPVGMDHLCLIMETSSVATLMTHLQETQVEVFWGPVERHHSTSVYVYDPDGVHVELRVDAASDITPSA